MRSSLSSVCLCNVARQWLSEHVPAAMNIHATKEEPFGTVSCAVRVVTDTQYVAFYTKKYQESSWS